MSWQTEGPASRTSARVSATALLSLAVAAGAVALTEGLDWIGWGADEDPATVVDPAPEPRTIHVATDGDDAAAGTSDAPKQTLAAAVKESNGGDTIQVGAGTYREELKIENRPGLRLVAAPGAEVWLDGSVVVDSWERHGDLWVAEGWTTEFDSSPTYSWGAPDHDQPGWSFLDPEYPMAAHPDQVWLDDDPQVQVGARREVREGTFYVDVDRDELVLGSDPEGYTVTASTLSRALRVRSEEMLLQGIGIRKYAPSVPHMGALTVEAPGVTLDGLTITDNATTGVHVLSEDVTLQDVLLTGNGKMGMTATEADGLELLRVTARDNNTEHFNPSPAAGGVKIGRSTGVLVRDSVFSENHATGIWFDESVSDLRLITSQMVGNARHGVSVELVGSAVVAGNVVARNGGNGLKLNNCEDVEVWNNTFVDNNRSINIVQDDRDLDPRGSFRDPDLRLTWQTQDITVRNNVLARTGQTPLVGDEARTCLLCVEDYSGRWTAAEMDVTALGNAYLRPDAMSPKWVVVWARRDKDPYVFRSMEEFRQTVYQEGQGAELTGPPALSEDLQPLPVLTALDDSVAVPLPRAIADLLGRPEGDQHLGAWLTTPPRDQPPLSSSTGTSAEGSAR